jgi:HEAT repeat protein
MRSLTPFRLLTLAVLSPAYALVAQPSPTPEDLARDLRSPIAAVRIAAAEGLGKIGVSAVAAVPALARALEDPDVVVRSHAAWALGKIGRPAEVIVPLLITRLQSPSEEWPVRHNAGLSLSWIGAPAIPAVRNALKHEDSWARAYAADALTRIGPADRYAGEIVPLAGQLLSEADPAIRRYALQLLGQFRERGADYVPEILRLLSDTDHTVRTSAAQTLPTLGKKAVAGVPHLLKLLKEDKDQWVRITSADALGEIGDASPQVVAGLVAAFTDGKERVGAYAVMALGKMGEAAVPVLLDTLKAEPKIARMFAVDALALIGTRAGAKTDMVLEHLARLVQTDKEWEVRARSAAALGIIKLSNDHVREALKAGASDEHEIVRAHAGKAAETLAKVARAP